MDWPKLSERLARTHGERAEPLIAAFRAAYPAAPPVEIAALIASAPMGRVGPLAQARRKAATGGAPAYLYAFAWQTPVLDGRPRAFHCSDLAFAFDNIDRCLNHTGGGAAARVLAGKMADAWIAFARTGDPNHVGLPAWATVTGEGAVTMVFDEACRAVAGLDAEALAAVG